MKTILFLLSVVVGCSGYTQPFRQPFAKPVVAVARRLDSLHQLFSGINYAVHYNPANAMLLRQATDRVTTANALYCGYFCGGIILPVTGLQLQGLRLSENQVQLNWQTRTETNTKGFVVERSFGTPDHFERCGWLPAVGNSTIGRKYKTLDANGYPAVTYYRLQQQDNDGNITYSNTVAVKGYSTVAAVSILPNPGRQATTVVVLQGFRPNEAVTLTVTDAGGRVVATTKHTASAGSFQVALASLSPLASGFYSITATNASQKAAASCVLLP